MATLTEKLLLLPSLGLVLGETTLAAVTGPFRSKDAAPTLLEHVVNTLVRGLIAHLTIGQMQ